MSRNLYAEVADRIIGELEKGAAPWVKPWSATAGRNQPANAVTNRPYSGVNVVMLWTAMENNAWPTPRFLTFKQALDAGGNVRKGEHGTKVYFVKRLIVRDKDGDEDDRKQIPLLREYTVFNVAQCEKLPERLTAPVVVKCRNPNERDAEIDEFLVATGADIREGGGGDRAYYTTTGDFIATPNWRDFKSAASFYATTFHELGHWTGAKARLDREFGKRFGDRAYAAEELVAELTSAFLCAEWDIDGELRHAGYIGNWITLLKGDPQAFFTAASKAQAAADYVRGKVLEDAPELAEAA